MAQMRSRFPISEHSREHRRRRPKKQYPPALLKALGRRIRELRLAQGYSQEAFADKCGLHRTFMGTLERGKSNVSFSNLAKVAETLGVTLSELLTGVEAGAEQ